MDNKVLIEVIVPSLEKHFDIYVPINKRVYLITDLIKKSLYELTNFEFDLNKNYYLYDYLTGNMLDNNSLLRNTDIRNNSKVILI